MKNSESIKHMLSQNLIDIGQQWFRNTFSERKEVEKSKNEDQKFINMEDHYWDNLDHTKVHDEEYDNEYSPICEVDEIYMEYENFEAYTFFLIIARKWRMGGGYSSDRGICWLSLKTLLDVNIFKKKRKKNFTMLYS